jgi:hypothetical protein
MCESPSDIQKECSIIQNEFLTKWNGPKQEVLNIVISKDESENLINSFVYKNEIFKDLDFQLD